VRLWRWIGVVRHRRGEISADRANGAGKTLLTDDRGLPADSGKVLLEESARKVPRARHTQLGIARRSRNRLFTEMPAGDVVVGRTPGHKTSVLGALLAAASHKEEREAVDRAMALLEFVGIGDRARRRQKPSTATSAAWRSRRACTERSCCASTSPRRLQPAEKEDSWG